MVDPEELEEIEEKILELEERIELLEERIEKIEKILNDLWSSLESVNYRNTYYRR